MIKATGFAVGICTVEKDGKEPEDKVCITATHTGDSVALSLERAKSFSMQLIIAISKLEEENESNAD